MALPVLNNSNSIANLPMDANSISQAVLTAASRTGHLQIYNNGTIAFNNNISGGSAPSATKESGGLGYSGMSILNEIRNYLESINGNITRFIETSQRQTEITKNLLEAQTAKTDIEAPRSATQEKGMGADFKKTFQDFFDSMKDSFSGITGGMKGGLMGGMLGGLLRGVFGFILKGFGALFLGYLAAKKIGEIPIGNGQTIGDKVKELTEDAYKYILSVGENGSSDMAEPGEMGNEGGTSTPSSAPSGTSPSGSPSSSPTGTTTPSTTRSAPSTTSPQRTAIPSRETFTTSSDWATDADLSGITFSDHSRKGLSNKIHKQILKSLAQRLQYIKKKVGKGTLHINSGHRPRWYNERCKGAAKESLHIKRMAADINTSNMSIAEKKKLIVAASESGCGGIGIYGGFIHVDIGRRRTWTSIPSWAKEVMNKHLAGKYKMGDEHFVDDDKTASQQDAEPGEAGNNQGKTQPEGKVDTNTPNQVPPSSGGNIPEQKEPTADRAEPSPVTSGGEEEEEGEETSEKVLEDPSLSQKTAIKVNKKQTPKKGNAQEAMNFFSKYWTKEQSAGIVGNLQFESDNTFDPHQKQKGGGTGYGIAQWEKPRQKLFKDVMKKDIRESSFQDQLRFVQWELTHGVYKKAGNKLKNTKTVKDATLAFRAFYEIPGGNNNPDNPHKSDKQRIQYAQNAFGGVSEEPQLADQKPSTEGGAARPSSGQQSTTEGGSAQQEPQTFEDKAKQVGEAVAETAEEAIEWSKEKLSQLAKDFGPNRDKLNKMLSFGINEIYDIAGVDKRKRVKIEGNKVVPYNEDTATQQPTEGQALPSPTTRGEEEEEAEDTSERVLEDPSLKNLTASLVGSENTAKTGDAIYTSSAGVKTGEQQLTLAKVDAAKSAPTVINNVSPQGKQKGDNTDGVMGAVPNVRQKTDSTLEEIQYRNFRGTGVV